MQKLLPIFSVALATLFSSTFAQTTAELDIIYRDFSVREGGFEQFLGCDDQSNPNSIGICTDGNNYGVCGTINGGSQLKYGECGNNGGSDKNKKGYSNGPDRLTNCGDDNWNWGGPKQNDGHVRVTRGMVQDWLYYDVNNCPPEDIMEDPDGDRDFIKYRYCARPQQGNGNCGSGDRIAYWFSKSTPDGDGYGAKEIRDIIILRRQGDGTFLINHDYNEISDEWNDGGFFPLDKYDTKPLNQVNDQNDVTWGRESLNYWCPTSSTGNTNPTGICKTWYDNGGPKSRTAGRTTANNGDNTVKQKLHNYGFSAAGSGTFKYFNGSKDVFEFIGDDDMWIFIDGELAADLGGVHLAAPARIEIEDYAQRKGWQDGSTHAINFFYMDRNTDGSNFRLKMSLTELSSSRFGTPVIKSSVTTVDDDNNYSTLLYVSSKLNEDDLKSFIGKTDNYGIIVKSVNDDYKKLCGYRIDNITYIGDEKEGYAYKMEGVVICDGVVRSLAGGDSLSFNVGYSTYDNSGACNAATFNNSPCNSLPLSSGVSPIRNTAGREADKLEYGVNTNKLKAPNPDPTIPDQGVVKPPFASPDQAFGGGATGNGTLGVISGGTGGGTISSNIAATPSVSQTANGTDNVNAFGAVGTTLPSNQTGELILTAYPSASDPNYQDYVDGKYFGLPPSANQDCADGLCGIADPGAQNEVEGYGVTGGYAFVKNGFSSKGEGSADGSLHLSPTRCTATINGEKANINCLSFNFVTLQPFQIAVTVYDHLGNFVTQYRESVNEQEFRYVTQGPNYSTDNYNNWPTASANCVTPTTENYGNENVLTTNGRVNVGVNIYPYSQRGRKFGNGVYIVKVDRVDLPFKGCYSDGNVSDVGEYDFIRYHSDLKFGWMRAKND